jgi:hypothetical protein
VCAVVFPIVDEVPVHPQTKVIPNFLYPNAVSLIGFHYRVWPNVIYSMKAAVLAKVRPRVVFSVGKETIKRKSVTIDFAFSVLVVFAISLRQVFENVFSL